MPNAIEAIELRKSYGDVVALDGATFSVGPGEIFGLLGPNGAGKSTTIRILTTLSRPTAGQARVLGLDVLRDPQRVRRAIGVIAQKSGVDPEATGRENLRLAGQLHGLGGQHLDRRVASLLERLGLADAAERVAGTYSGGMERKLAVAMGLVHRPQILFLDEPTSGLDPEARADVWQEVQHLAADEGLTILLTTHYLEEADHLAGRLAIIDRGRVVAIGTPAQLKGELHGDAIQIELAERADETVASALRAVGAIHEVKLDGCTVHARAKSGASALPAVLAALARSAVGVAAATVARPSLDDVYLRYAGRAFSAADAIGTDGKAASEQ